MRARSMRATMAIQLGVLPPPAGAATTTWRAEIERGGDEALYASVVPAPDGFWLAGNASGTSWISRHGRDGSVSALQRFHAPIGAGRADSRGDLVLRNEPSGVDLLVSVEECIVERGALGAPRVVLSRDPGAPDGGDGVFESTEVYGYGQSDGLVRTQRDCRATPVPAIDRDEIVAVRNAPDAAAAYVLAGDSYLADELLRVDATRIQWRMPLESIAPGARSAYVLGVDAGGVGLRLELAEGSPRIVRIEADGRVAWQREIPGQGLGVLAWLPAPLLVRHSELSVSAFEALDPATGETRFVTSSPVPLRYLQLLPSSRADGGWRLSGREDELGDSILDVAPDGRVRVRWRSDDYRDQAMVELADGSVLVRRDVDPFQSTDQEATWSLVAPDVTTGPGRVLDGVGRAPLSRAPALLARGPDDAMLAGWQEGLRGSIARVEPDGRVAWTVDLPRGDFGVLRLVGAAMHATRACVLTDSAGLGRLRCFDARTGAPAFDLRVADSSSNLRIGAFGDGIHLVDARIVEVDGNRSAVPQLRVLGPSGDERLRRDLPLESPYDRLSQFGPSGELIANTFGAARTVRAIAPDATLRWRIERPGDSSLVTRPTGDGGALLVDFAFNTTVRTTDVTRLDGAGQLRWQRSFGDVSFAALGSDWLVRDETTTRRLADADGSERWILPVTSNDFLRAAAPDGSGFVQGASWYDGNGSRVGSLVEPANLIGSTLLRFDGAGRLLRLASQVDEQGSVLVLERLERDAGTGPRAILAAAGLWHVPSVPGQGVALAVDARNGNAEGRWLTFAPSATPRPAVRIDAQRWYRLSGRAAIDGDAIALRIEAPQPAGFDGGPVQWRAVGTARWRMRECARVELDYEIADGGPARTGLLVLERLDGGDDCEARPGARSRMDVDAWQPDGEPGRALLVAQRRDGSVFAAWPTVVPAGGDAGRPHWLTLQGDGGALRIERTLGGGFVDVATRDTLTIGSATLRRLGCDRLAIDYRFDAGEVAAPFDERSGRLVLQRRGRCPR